MDNIINLNPLGEDSIKGGIFFGSSLTPAGSFSNVPKYLTQQQIAEKEASLMLTLQKVKDSLKNRLEEETGGAVDEEENIEKFLHDFTGLLIDYRDLRNYIFYGSANTELAYNIRYIIENYPYSTLVGQKYGSSFISLTNKIINGKEQTEILFPEMFVHPDGKFDRIILDNFNRFAYFDNDPTFNWGNQEIVDRNGRKYKILNVITPYKSNTIHKVDNMVNAVATDPNGFMYNTVRVYVDTDPTASYTIGQWVEFRDVLCKDTTKTMKVNIPVPGSVNSYYSYSVAQEKFVITGFGTTGPDHYFTIRRVNASNAYEDIELETYGYSDPATMLYDGVNKGLVRRTPLDQNKRPYWIKITIDGKLTKDALMTFVHGDENKTGFMISPKASVINDWEINLTPVQRMLLAPTPINPTPWPRRTITNNIMNIAEGDFTEDTFLTWLKSPTSMLVKKEGEEDEEAYGEDLYYEYRLVRALVTDEVHSNQILRRMVPHDFISELNDTDDFYFQRFLLIAGWFFDQIRMYVKFVKYAHTINHTEFDQLSPEYYRYYSDYYGLDLFNDDSIDFTKLVIKTEPGYYFVDANDQANNKYYRNTLQKLQYERQKRLLLSLFYLYKIKGTQACIHQLISLLGAPDGFLSLNEYAFAVADRDDVGYPTKGYRGDRVIDNDKVHTPNITFEIDPNYLVDKENINNPINKPYVYKQMLDNEYVHNLREISVHTDPNGAIEKQIEDVFGQQKYNYIRFGKGEFANLQNTELGGQYFLLPLSLPDRFYGVSVDYMIPRAGLKKGIGADTEEATVNLCSLYKLQGIAPKTPIQITNITLSVNQAIATVTVAAPHNFSAGENVFINGVTGLIGINDVMFEAQDIVNSNTFTIIGDFSDVYTGGGSVLSGELNKFINTKTVETDDDPDTVQDEYMLDKSLDFSYPLAVTYSKRNYISDIDFAQDSQDPANPAIDGYTNPANDFNILKQRFPRSQYVDGSYLITRLEGNDLVFRVRIQSENNLASFVERVAILENVFAADGLNHSLRMIFMEEGVEVYKDYEYIGTAKWIPPYINDENYPYRAYEIPKSIIKTLANNSDECFDYYEPILATDLVAIEAVANTGADKINWWDMFIGMPENVDMWFRKVSFFENNTINDYDIGDRITDEENHTAEFYVFEVARPDKNNTKEQELQGLSIPAVFNQKVPNAIPEYYGFALPQGPDQYNRNIIPLLKLTDKGLYNEKVNNMQLGKRQDFFNFSDLFRNNAWQPDIHKSYEYELFNGELHKLYELYSAQVLTYESLTEFLNLVEGKFRSAFQQFIPIVINLLEFGRLIKNTEFNQAKYRVPGANKVCGGVLTSNKSFMSSMVFATDPNNADSLEANGLKEGVDIGMNFITAGGTNVIAYELVPWNTTKALTLRDLVAVINNQPANTGIWRAAYVNEMFRLEVDYDAFMSAYGESANDLVLSLWQFGGPKTFDYKLAYGNPSVYGIHPDKLNHCGDIIEYGSSDQDTCGSVRYALPNSTDVPVWVYYESEGKPAIYPKLAAEISSDVIYIKKSTE